MADPQTTTSTSTTSSTDTQPPDTSSTTRRPGGDSFHPGGPGEPEIDATDEAMGKNMVHEMNLVNGEDGGQYDLTHGVKYSYNRERELKRANRMDLWKDEYRYGHHYGDEFINPWEQGAFMKFDLKPGKSASAGIKAWLAGVTVAECNSAVVAMQINTFRKAIGDKKFDAQFGSADPTIDKGVTRRLVIKPGTDGTPVDGMVDATELAKKSVDGPGRDPNTGTASDEEKEALLKPGEWYYFYNHPKYLLKHPGGAWQGENSLYMGKNAKGERLWAGMGATDKTETTMVDEMVSAYNAPRDGEDARAIKDQQLQGPDGKWRDKKYDPAGGVFPDTVDANQILNDPPYSDIDGTTRKGGFLPIAGMSLNPSKVKANRDGG